MTEEIEKAEDTAPAKNMIEDRGTIVVQLLYDQSPILNKEELTKQLQSIDPMIEALDGDICLFKNDRYRVHLPEGLGDNPAGIVTVLPLMKFDKDLLLPSLQQTFDWAQAETAISSCHHGLVVADILGSALKAQDRLTNIQTVLAGVLAEHPPKAIHWLTSQRLVEPTRMLREFSENGLSSIFAGAINVRSFRDQADISNHIFDTLGLSYFGLLDFQCHFRTLEPAEVAAKLFNLAAYVWEKGNIIENGSTVSGIDGQPWISTFEWALVAPERPLIDLNPGAGVTARKS